MGRACVFQCISGWPSCPDALKAAPLYAVSQIPQKSQEEASVAPSLFHDVCVNFGENIAPGLPQGGSGTEEVSYGLEPRLVIKAVAEPLISSQTAQLRTRQY